MFCSVGCNALNINVVAALVTMFCGALLLIWVTNSFF